MEIVRTLCKRAEDKLKALVSQHDELVTESERVDALIMKKRAEILAVQAAVGAYKIALGEPFDTKTLPPDFSEIANEQS
jgi:hypothetical protein